MKLPTGMRRSCPGPSRGASGFTITELAVVMVIVALLLGGLLVPLVSQFDQASVRATEKTINDARDAMLGFAIANGRLPCPALAPGPGITGTESGGGGAACTTKVNGVADGFLPGVTLGLSPLDARGYLLDAWGNPIRYAVTVVNSDVFTNTNGLRDYWQVNGAPPTPNLQVCTTGSAITQAGTSSAGCASASTLTNTAVAVLYSTGKNASWGGTGNDERHNRNPNTSVAADRVYLLHDPTPSGNPNGEFDDLVDWLSPNVLYNRMVAAGKLP